MRLLLSVNLKSKINKIIKKIKIKVTKAIKMILYFIVRSTLFSARSINPAPMFWPIRVAAALLKPQAGRIKKTTFLIAI